jgi:hypothetical protein
MIPDNRDICTGPKKEPALESTIYFKTVYIVAIPNCHGIPVRQGRGNGPEALFSGAYRVFLHRLKYFYILYLLRRHPEQELRSSAFRAKSRKRNKNPGPLFFERQEAVRKTGHQREANK